MRFVVLALSLVALAVVFVWVVSSGQLNKTSMADKLSVLTNLVPYLLFGMFVAQVAAVYLLVRFSQRAPLVTALAVHSAAVDEVKTPQEQVNTEWVLEALAGGGDCC